MFTDFLHGDLSNFLQTLSKWIVEAISLAYETSGCPLITAIRVHSTWGMWASKGFHSRCL